MLDRQTEEPNLTALLAQSLRARGNSPNLSLDVNVATCQVLSALSEGGALPADAFDTLVALNRTLAGAPEGEILDSLTRQSILLEKLWLHFASKGATETRPDQAASLIKAALNCQRALSNVLGTIHHLHEGKVNAKAIESN